jgi:hypothetical protein
VATFLGQWTAEPPTKAALLAQLSNEHPLLRERVLRSLESGLKDGAVAGTLKLMLDDPVRNVRVAAAWVMRATVDMQGRAGQDLPRMLDLEADAQQPVRPGPSLGEAGSGHPADFAARPGSSLTAQFKPSFQKTG